MPQSIDIDAGEIEYVDPPMVITANADISGDRMFLGLGSYYGKPTTWIPSTDPAVLLTQLTPSQVQATLLVGGTVKPAGGRYWLYAKLEDNPEIIEPRFDTRSIQVVYTGTPTYP